MLAFKKFYIVTITFAVEMKKFIVAIIAILYITSSTGATVHVHYCMGKLVEKKVWQNNNNKCSKCGMSYSKSIKKSCCKDEHKEIKISKDQNSSTNFLTSIQPSFEAIFTTFSAFSIAEFATISGKKPTTNSPPKYCKTAVYIKNCSFLI